jgi:hypothetical protein
MVEAVQAAADKMRGGRPRRLTHTESEAVQT